MCVCIFFSNQPFNQPSAPCGTSFARGVSFQSRPVWVLAQLPRLRALSRCPPSGSHTAAPSYRLGLRSSHPLWCVGRAASPKERTDRGSDRTHLSLKESLNRRSLGNTTHSLLHRESDALPRQHSPDFVVFKVSQTFEAMESFFLTVSVILHEIPGRPGKEIW